MRLAALGIAMMAAAMAFDLVRVFVTHAHVGPVEWVVGVVLLAGLVAGVTRFSRQSFRRT
jgi:hypothetical protein